MIKPTIGRVLHYWPTHDETEQPYPVLVTNVISDYAVGVAGFDRIGGIVHNSSVALVQEGVDGEAPGDYPGPHCRWVPHQLGHVVANQPQAVPREPAHFSDGQGVAEGQAVQGAGALGLNDAGAKEDPKSN